MASSVLGLFITPVFPSEREDMFSPAPGCAEPTSLVKPTYLRSSLTIPSSIETMEADVLWKLFHSIFRFITESRYGVNNFRKLG